MTIDSGGQKIKELGRVDKGITAFEFIIMVFMMLVVVILTLNICVMIFAADVCDRTCKDCARAAGEEPTSAQALSAAEAVASAHTLDTIVLYGPVTPSLVKVELLVYQDYGGAPPNPGPAPGGGSPGPYVTVRTTLLAKIPAPIFFFGQAGFNQGQLKFQSIYTYPITNTIVAENPTPSVSPPSLPPSPPPPAASTGTTGVSGPAPGSSTAVTSTITAADTNGSTGGPGLSSSPAVTTVTVASPSPSPSTSPATAPSPVFSGPSQDAGVGGNG